LRTASVGLEAFHLSADIAPLVEAIDALNVKSDGVYVDCTFDAAVIAARFCNDWESAVAHRTGP
jgi:hypothetical protein